ncbi:hypothetical protein [Anoxybacillus sp. KU2-6(11)]|uniref:hypothetical protein n=1 Tax=Anoxybacillus sp. KU2-6(11) TaxID=1535751 RepID=UPI001E2FD4A5|nr:hypothetical protein [Anoxybacillus sp. KU2-6(11)]
MLDKGGERFQVIFLRRLLALLLFGMIHAFFIWHGDILIGYAIRWFVSFSVFSSERKRCATGRFRFGAVGLSVPPYSCG